MSPAEDPGWRPAVAQAARIVAFRRPSGSLLTVLRATVVFLGIAATVTTAIGVVLTRGTGDVRISSVTARIVLIGAVLAATLVGAVTRAERPDLRGPGQLALWLFTTTMRRVLAAASVGPVGFLLTWLAHTGVHTVVAGIASIVLLALAAPTARTLERWQATVSGAGSDLVVHDALSAPYH